MTRGIAPVVGGRVTYATGLRVAIGGVVRDVKRALVACGGVAREVWPPDYLPPGDPTPPEAPPAAASAIDREDAPTDARAGYRFTNSNGSAEWDRFNSVVGVQFVNPPPEPTQFLIRMDVVSGSLQGDSTGVWIDPTNKNVHEWFIENTADTDSTVTAEGTFRIALNDGGSPAAGSEVTQTVNFRAEVRDVGDGFLWNDDPWLLEDFTVGEPAQVRIAASYTPYSTLGYGRGFEGTDNRLKFEELYSEETTRTEVVRVEPVSGDTGQLTGAALNTDLPLDFVNATFHQWILRADNDQDSYEAVVDFIFKDGLGNPTAKRVTMRVGRDDGLTSPTVPTDLVGVFGIISAPTYASVSLRVRADGELRVWDQAEEYPSPGQSTWPKFWGEDGGGGLVTDPENWSCRLIQNSGNGYAPNAPAGRRPLGEWAKVGDNTRWDYIATINDGLPLSRSIDWIVQIRNDLNGSITEIEATFTVTLTSSAGGPPGGDPPPIFPPLNP